jgi:hypothetical protein
MKQKESRNEGATIQKIITLSYAYYVSASYSNYCSTFQMKGSTNETKTLDSLVLAL